MPIHPRYRVTFTAPGTYRYADSDNPSVTGNRRCAVREEGEE